MKNNATGSSSTYNQIERDYNTIRAALSSKPAILRTILKESQRQAQEYTASAIRKGIESKLDIPERLTQAEHRYQKTLNKQAEELFALYKNLPIDQKLDLLIYAEEIGKVNDQARKLSRQQMSASRTETIATYHRNKLSNQATTQIGSVPIPTADPSPNKTLPPNAPQEKGLVNEIGLGSPAAITINLPFTIIPGLPALSKILAIIDKTTHFDLGYTLKCVADSETNPHGGHDLLYRLSYVGAGVMSSKFNMQISPIALKLEDSPDAGKWGGSSSIFTRQHSDGLGSKVTLNFNDSDAGLSYAHEYSYQKPSNKIISTFTGGKYFDSDGPAIRIPAPYVPTIERVANSLPNKEEVGIIFNHINKVIPINQVFEIGLSLATKVSSLVEKEHPTVYSAKRLLQQQVTESGLTVEEQAIVFARIGKNYANSVDQGMLPNVQVAEKSLMEKSTTAGR